jgi:hypothetical protein
MRLLSEAREVLSAKASAEMPTDGAGDGGRLTRKGNPGRYPERER